jgi:pimeloyl-ACP methyl ester carboxylesterase
MPTVSTNGIEMFYERKGSGEPLLLVPGLLFGAEHWRPQTDVLASDYDVIAVDLRGQYHTTTTDNQADYDMWNQTEDVRGFIGMRMALKHPEALRDLVLIDTQSHSEDPEKAAMYAAMRQILRAGQFDAVAPALPASFFCDDFIANHSDQVEAWLARLREGNHDGSAHASQGVDERDDITDRLGEIKLPALVAHGTEDVPIEIERAEEMASLIPGAKFVRIEGAGHQSNVDHPDEVTALIRDFLAEVRQAATTGAAR